MSFLTKFSLRNPLAIFLLVLLVFAGGTVSMLKFKQEQLPNVAFPGIFVSAVYPGASPQAVQTDVTKPLEQAVRNVEGVKSIETTSSNSSSFIQVGFSYRDDMKEKRKEVEEALSNVQLPKGVEKPSIKFFSSGSQAMMYTAVTADNAIQLKKLVEQQLLPQLKSIDGVAKVDVKGLVNNDIYVQFKQEQLKTYNLTYQQIEQVLSMNNMTVPVGQAADKPVILTGNMTGVEALKNFVLLPNVTMNDIATISVGTNKPAIVRVNGKPSVSIDIYKTGEANTVEVSDAVRKELKAIDAKTTILYDRSEDVKESVHSLAREGLLGALFASVVILFFLRDVRATIIAIVSIPLSMFIAFIALKTWTDVTLNIMTLGGLAVATGRVVDDSIVVIENIVRRIQREKISKELVLEGTREVGKAILSSTVTTVAVFAPLGLLQGMTGEFFRPFALTVCFALAASLLVAITVVPIMAWGLMRNVTPKEHEESTLSVIYKGLLHGSLNRKGLVLVMATLFFIGSLAPLAMGKVATTMLPEGDLKFAMGTLTMPKGTTYAELTKEATRIDEVLQKQQEVKLSNVTMAGEDMFGQNSDDATQASWFVLLKKETNVKKFTKRMKTTIKVANGSEFKIGAEGDRASTINITVNGPSVEKIAKATTIITNKVKGVRGTDKVTNNVSASAEGIELVVRGKDAAKYGLSVAQASMALRPYLTESELGKIDNHTIYASFANLNVTSLRQIKQLPVATMMGKAVTVQDIADINVVQLPSSIMMKNGKSYAAVTGVITVKDVAKVNKAIEAKLANVKLPKGTSYSLGGSNEDMQQMMNDMMLAFAIAIGMVYIVLVVTFHEGRAPLAILFSLPFAFSGGLIATVVTGNPLSISSMIGFLMLIGIVVTNAIVYIERVHQQRDEGMTIREALIEAGGTRLRPILMTAIATVCALIPLALGFGGGAIISSGLAVVVIGGLVASTILTLFIVPVMYELFHFKQSRRERELVKQRKTA